MSPETVPNSPLEIARKALYKIATTEAWRPIGDSVVAAIQQEARQALGEIDQAESHALDA
jgi:hypothetical protein